MRTVAQGLILIFPKCEDLGVKGRKSWLRITRPGKHTKNYGKSPFLMGKPHYKWQFSIAMLVYQRVYITTKTLRMDV
jgi:hypothetical protein